MGNNSYISSFSKLRLHTIVLLLFALYLTSEPVLATGDLEDYFIFQENNKKGVRNSSDEVVIPAEYDDLGWSLGEFHPLGEVLGYMENGLWGLITLKNKKISPPKYQNLYPLNRQLIVASISHKIENQELYGIIDPEDKLVQDFEYGWLSMFNNLIVASKKIESQWRFGMMDLSYQEVLPFKYHRIKTLNNRFAVVIEKDKSGLVDATGQVVAPPKYHQIELEGNSFKGKLFDSYEIKNEQNELLATYELKSLKAATKGVILATGLNSSQLIHTDGQILKSYPNTEVFEFSGDKAIIQRKGYYGIIDDTGKEIVSPAYRSIWIRESFVGTQDQSGKWSLLNGELTEISNREYQEIQPPTEGLFPIKRLESWGFIDGQGEEVIPPQYQKVSNFSGNSAYANYLGSWGVIDKTGNWLIKPRYDKLEKINQHVYLYQSGSHYGLATTEEQAIYETTNKLKYTDTGIIEESKDGLYALISLQGEKMLSLQYYSINTFEEDPRYYRFEDDKGLGIFNIAQGSFFRDTAIQEIRTLDEGYIGVRINDQYGLIDLNGKLRIANRYEDVGVFNEDMLPVQIRGRWGYVDRIERLKIQPVYDAADHFINDLAIVSSNNKYGLIDKSGKVILSLEYDRIERLSEGQFICYLNQKVGLVDIDGRVLLYPGYARLETLANGHLKAQKNGKQGLITKHGRTLIPPVYDELRYDESNDLYLLTKKSPWDVIKL